MKIVIDRDKEVNKLKEMIDTLTDKKDLQSVRFAINMLENIEGTPLPKGHGRLIDEEDIALIDEQFYVPSDYYVAESAINDAPTIVEADKGSDSE